MSIEILKLGLAMSVQDRGRFGFRAFGVPVSGALDLLAYEMANALLGNEAEVPVLELTMNGPSLRFHEDTVLAITGANMKPVDENGYPIPMWQAVTMTAGQTIKFGYAVEGMRAYVAFAGGIDSKLVMNSASTYNRASIYPLLGRAFQVGDRFQMKGTKNVFFGYLPIEHRPTYSKDIVVRVVLGPHDDAFTKEGLEVFLSSHYRVSPTSDRMGIRLEGGAIVHKGEADIISDGIVPGAIQVPKDGQPIVLLADAQTTGGYTKIGHIIQEDICRMAQLCPHDTVRFKAISLEEAHACLKQKKWCDRRQVVALNPRSRRYFEIKEGRQLYKVTVEEV